MNHILNRKNINFPQKKYMMNIPWQEHYMMIEEIKKSSCFRLWLNPSSHKAIKLIPTDLFILVSSTGECI